MKHLPAQQKESKQNQEDRQRCDNRSTEDLVDTYINDLAQRFFPPTVQILSDAVKTTTVSVRE